MKSCITIWYFIVLMMYLVIQCTWWRIGMRRC
jgi:hypothetical protein